MKPEIIIFTIAIITGILYTFSGLSNGSPETLSKLYLVIVSGITIPAYVLSRIYNRQKQ